MEITKKKEERPKATLKLKIKSLEPKTAPKMAYTDPYGGGPVAGGAPVIGYS